MEKISLIDKTAYDEARRLLPFSCVDILPLSGKSFLLGKRSIAPGKGNWFPVGGRIWRNETLLEAAKRKAKEELGVDVDSALLFQRGTHEFILADNTKDSRHDVVTVYSIPFAEKPKFDFDRKQLEEVKWFEAIDRSWHPYTQEVLKNIGFTYESAK